MKVCICGVRHKTVYKRLMCGRQLKRGDAFLIRLKANRLFPEVERGERDMTPRLVKK